MKYLFLIISCWLAVIGLIIRAVNLRNASRRDQPIFIPGRIGKPTNHDSLTEPRDNVWNYDSYRFNLRIEENPIYRVEFYSITNGWEINYPKELDEFKPGERNCKDFNLSPGHTRIDNADFTGIVEVKAEYTDVNKKRKSQIIRFGGGWK